MNRPKTCIPMAGWLHHITLLKREHTWEAFYVREKLWCLFYGHCKFQGEVVRTGGIAKRKYIPHNFFYRSRMHTVFSSWVVHFMCSSNSADIWTYGNEKYSNLFPNMHERVSFPSQLLYDIVTCGLLRQNYLYLFFDLVKNGRMVGTRQNWLPSLQDDSDKR